MRTLDDIHRILVQETGVDPKKRSHKASIMDGKKMFCGLSYPAYNQEDIACFLGYFDRSVACKQIKSHINSYETDWKYRYVFDNLKKKLFPSQV